MIAEFTALAGAQGEFHFAAQEAEGADGLDQVAVGHLNLRLQFALVGADARERYAVAALPVLTFQPAKVERREEAFRSPVFEAEQCAEADLVDSGGAHAVGSVKAIGEVGFPALRVMDVISLAVISFLVDQHRVESVPAEFGILRGFHRLDLHRQRGEVRAEQIEGFDEIRHGHLVGFAGQQEQVIEPLFLQGAGLAENLGRVERAAGDFIPG